MRILSTLILGAVLSFTAMPAAAQIAPGTSVTGEVEGRFIGRVAFEKAPGIYVINVVMDGQFKSGVPFEGPLELEIETTETLTPNETIRGRVRALMAGAVDKYDDTGLQFSAQASTVDYNWQTISAFGGTSKGGGTNVFKLELADIIFSVYGSSEGNDI